MGVAHVQTKAKVAKAAKAAKASPRRETRARRDERKRPPSLMVQAGTARKRKHKKSDCRMMKSDIAAGKCDKSGKPIGVNALSAEGATQPFPCPNGSQTFQQTEKVAST